MWHDTVKPEGLTLTRLFTAHAVAVEHVKAQRGSPTAEHPR
jgi:hypothetical protein